MSRLGKAKENRKINLSPFSVPFFARWAAPAELFVRGIKWMMILKSTEILF